MSPGQAGRPSAPGPLPSPHALPRNPPPPPEAVGYMSSHPVEGQPKRMGTRAACSCRLMREHGATHKVFLPQTECESDQASACNYHFGRITGNRETCSTRHEDIVRKFQTVKLSPGQTEETQFLQHIHFGAKNRGETTNER